MTSFCVNGRFGRIGMTAALAVISVFPAVAQETAPTRTGAPVVLAPPTVNEPTTLPPKSQPSSRPAPAAEPPGRASPEGGIRVGTLGSIDPDSAGVLDSSAGGLGVEMWAGTRAPLARRLLEFSGRQPALPAARQLLRRLLLTSARPPLAKGGGAKPSNKRSSASTSLIAHRVDRLLAMGDVDGAHRLLGVVPARVGEEAVARARMNTAFLMNDNSGACGEALSRIESFQGESWRKAYVFCQHLAGEKSRAAIGAALLREQGIEDQAFFTLMGILGGDKASKFEPPNDITPLHLAMMRTARIQIPGDMIETGAALVLRTIASSPNASVEIRLDAAERAVAAGSLDPEDLRKLYGAVNFAPGAIAQALTTADGQAGPRARALLFHAAGAEPVPAARAEILAKALAVGRSQGRMTTVIRAFRPLFAQVPPREDLDWFAALAGRALFFAGDHDKALAWTALARRRPYSEQPLTPPAQQALGSGPEPGPVAAPSDVVLWPYSMLAAAASRDSRKGGAGAAPSGPKKQGSKAGVDLARGGAGTVVQLVTQDKTSIESRALDPIRPQSESEFDETAFRRWTMFESGYDAVIKSRRATLLLTLLDAVGTEVPQEAWLESAGPVRDAVAMPAQGLIAALEQAAKGGRAAEGVLLAIAVLGDAQGDRLHPAVIGPVVRGLFTLGFEKEARAIAIEAAFSAGL